MKKAVSIALWAILIASISDGAYAKRIYKPKAIKTQTTTGSARSVPGNNAELGGNNGNSASGSNTINNNLGNTGR